MNGGRGELRRDGVGEASKGHRQTETTTHRVSSETHKLSILEVLNVLNSRYLIGSFAVQFQLSFGLVDFRNDDSCFLFETNVILNIVLFQCSSSC
ncbi:hypothetical protein R6Q59_027691 [Mikania micrantha]